MRFETIRRHQTLSQLQMSLCPASQSQGQIALVPTMGSLHEGHVRLIQRAAELAPRVVVSIFVNPLQFGTGEDYHKYPRDLEKDFEVAKAAGATDLFSPPTAELTPADLEFKVDLGGMGNLLCGQFRPGHFSGVATIVLKLFNMVHPNYAVFGWKDAQQFVILKKMTKDFNLSVEMHAVETVRENDNLAMSSRNTYLPKEARAKAPILFQVLSDTKDRLLSSAPENVSRILAEAHIRLQSDDAIQLQYLKLVSLTNLKPLVRPELQNSMLAAALILDSTRLIDNVRF